MLLKEISIKEIEGYKIGQAEYRESATGCTVILPTNGAVTGIDVRGGGPASRESALLDPLAANNGVHAVLLSGGSAFGLNSASGVMKYLEERNIGYPTAAGVVPIVCASCIYDLELVTSKVRPDEKLAYEACINSETYNYQDGNYGAGCGATVGKIAGFANMMKAGVGSYAFQLDDLKVGAIAVVNALGDVFDYKTNKKIAGCFDYETNEFISSEEALYKSQSQLSLHTNTTIGAIITNAKLTKTELTKVASLAHDGLARSVNPVHTSHDGDTIYALANGTVQTSADIVGTIAARAFSEAITKAITSSEPEYNLKSYRSLE